MPDAHHSNPDLTACEDEIRLVPLCARCRNGHGGECHTPGCALWMNRAPDVPVQLVDADDEAHR